MITEAARIDLQCHTRASDGLLTAAELVDLAVEADLAVLAVTDHESIASLPDAIARGRQAGVYVLAGVEFSTRAPEHRDLHILGYFKEASPPGLEVLLSRIRTQRQERALRMAERLRELGMPLNDEGWRLHEGGSYGRPHLARALFQQGLVSSVDEGFALMSRRGPAYVPRPLLEPEEVIAQIHRSGGVAIAAHPGRGERPFAPEELPAELDGLEVYYPRHSAAQTADYLAYVKRRGLLATGGSDFHDPTGARLGQALCPPQDFLRLAARLDLQM